MSDIVIRPEQPADYAAIRSIVAAAFESDGEADLVEAIRDSDGYLPELSLVAESGGEIVGHVMISEVALDDAGTRRRAVSLAPLAVAPDWQNKGIGAALVRDVLGRADHRGEPLVILEGSPRYYGRLGFVHSVTLGIHISLPDWAPAEAAQVYRLSRYDSAIKGRVVYPPAFGVEG